MTIEIWLAYVGTVLIMMSTPGPSQLLMLSVSASNGFRRSIATAAGDLSANTIQILLAGFGLAAVITSWQYGLMVVKWTGVAYLLWIGVRQILGSFGSAGALQNSTPAGSGTLWWRGFITSASNPKAVVFFAALFPQFLSSQHPLAPQIAILGVTYIVIDACFLAAYGQGAVWLVRRLRSRYRAWVERIAGAGIIGAAVLLGLRSNER